FKMSGVEAKKTVSEQRDAAKVRNAEKPQLRLVSKVEVDRSRDALLTDFGKTTLEDRYLLPGESYQDMFARVATAYADDSDHAQRLGRRLPRHPPPRDRGVPRDPQAVRRLQPQGAEPAPRHLHHRRVHGSRARRNALRPAVAQDQGSGEDGRRPRPVAEDHRD